LMMPPFIVSLRRYCHAAADAYFLTLISSRRFRLISSSFFDAAATLRAAPPCRFRQIIDADVILRYDAMILRLMLSPPAAIFDGAAAFYRVITLCLPLPAAALMPCSLPLIFDYFLMMISFSSPLLLLLRFRFSPCFFAIFHYADFSYAAVMTTISLPLPLRFDYALRFSDIAAMLMPLYFAFHDRADAADADDAGLFDIFFAFLRFPLLCFRHTTPLFLLIRCFL